MTNLIKLSTIALLAVAMLAPTTADAQGKGRGRGQNREVKRRQDTKGEWQRIAYAGAALALLGQMNKDKTASYIGAAGSLYALHRYDEDSKSQDRIARSRAQFWNRPYFVKDGVRFNRKLVKKNGKRYYTFVCER
jgi:hypothetical protein